MNIQQSKAKMLGYILELTNRGVLTPAAKNADYLALHNQKADAEQKFLATIKKIHKRYSISRTPMPNMLGLTKGFDTITHYDTDITEMSAKGAKAYYFECDSQYASAVIEENVSGTWTTLKTIAPTTPYSGGFVAYKGNLNLSAVTNDVRVRFTGNYPYNIRNRALFAFNFPSDADVPDYTPWVTYTMPNDFMGLNKVVQRGSDRLYTNAKTMYWEGKNRLLLNYYDTASFDVLYYKYPKDLPEYDFQNPTKDDLVEFEIDPEAQELIPLGAAIGTIPQDKLTLAGFLTDQYRFKLAQLENSDTYSTPEIQNTAGW